MIKPARTSKRNDVPVNYDTDIITLRHSGSVDDLLTVIAKDRPNRNLAAALRAEADAFVTQFAQQALPDGRQRVVLHRRRPERFIQTEICASNWANPRKECRTVAISAR